VFTDEQFTRLENRFINDPRSWRAKTMTVGLLKDMQGLLLRLRAAERAIRPKGITFADARKEWRKSCGKEEAMG
jgi:hypothetical protein